MFLILIHQKVSQKSYVWELLFRALEKRFVCVDFFPVLLSIKHYCCRAHSLFLLQIFSSVLQVLYSIVFNNFILNCCDTRAAQVFIHMTPNNGQKKANKSLENSRSTMNALLLENAVQYSIVVHNNYVFFAITGLDFNRDFSPRDIQLQVFEKQVKLAFDLKAKGLQKPLFVHERDAHKEV